MKMREQAMKRRMETRKLALFLLLGLSLGVLTCFLAVSVFSANQQFSLTRRVWADQAEESGGHGSREGILPGIDQHTVDNATPAQLDGGADDNQGISSIADAISRLNEKSTSSKDTVTTAELVAEQKETQSRQIKEKKSLCDLSNWRTDVCEMTGDVRIHSNSSSILVLNSQATEESWQIKPYARKFDPSAMQHIKQVSVRSFSGGDGVVVPACTVNQTLVPAVVFVIGGYTGNYYHDYTDVLIPLFITTRHFNGDVQFIISTRNFWWVDKYKAILKQLSRHEIVYLDGDEQVRCHRRVIVGLHSHKPMSIDPERTPGGYSMLDFTKLMRVAYGLERDRPMWRAEEKPRMLLIQRKGTRQFTNLEEVARTAEAAGFAVQVAEAESMTRVAEFARVVNSCDVMAGLHGAGLTNFVYLPTGAVVVQVIPFGNLETISRGCFKNSSEDAGLRYLDYSVGVEESSLLEQYPRQHPVFTDPKSIHRQGWKKMGQVYLDHQDVKIDVDRFKPLLLVALDNLRQYTIED
ncbi:alpha-1,3-arabinosyltransferase XAT2-like isoform X1 [Zingiber officinale]|uniref:alpha-1,3-arabinosyltransferase XAT2-like isoform X1 n=1 Tax=Zingiber officinale TaxID=94328 RepID=UPI001C4C5433|nr:alpha-1,3-arabinosyltransferase XAT2-like isoform X1 [Zingiber officinale]